MAHTNWYDHDAPQTGWRANQCSVKLSLDSQERAGMDRINISIRGEELDIWGSRDWIRRIALALAEPLQKLTELDQAASTSAEASTSTKAELCVIES